MAANNPIYETLSKKCFTRWPFLEWKPEVRERSEALRITSCGDSIPFSERHLQAVWFDPLYRPAGLFTAAGESVVVEDPGRWNLEAGPDFINARLRIGGQRTLTGDIEIHKRPADWKAHGHRDDQAFAGVVAHVTYFPGSLATSCLPPGTVQIALKDAISSNQGFSFESIDVTSYPLSVPVGNASPCSRLLSSWQMHEVQSMLDLAGKERLASKAIKMSESISRNGVEQAFYEETMTALGYKHNRHAFRTLARTLSRSTLTEESAGDYITAYALLLGVSGLLPQGIRRTWGPGTKNFVRDLWNRWWRSPSEIREQTMPRSAWKLSGLRPHNHPVRRLAAAARLFSGKTDWRCGLKELNPQSSAAWIKTVIAQLQDLEFPFWSRRLGLGGKTQPANISLIGKERAAAILSNVVVPFEVAVGNGNEEILRHLPKEQDNGRIRLSACNLLGPDHNPAVYSDGLKQQGLIQILQDFCLWKESECRHCRLLDALREASERPRAKEG
jgi:hypothetical protein